MAFLAGFAVRRSSMVMTPRLPKVSKLRLNNVLTIFGRISIEWRRLASIRGSFSDLREAPRISAAIAGSAHAQIIPRNCTAGQARNNVASDGDEIRSSKRNKSERIASGEADTRRQGQYSIRVSKKKRIAPAVKTAGRSGRAPVQNRKWGRMDISIFKVQMKKRQGCPKRITLSGYNIRT